MNLRSLQDQWYGSFGTRPPKPGVDLVKWSHEWERLRDYIEAEGNFHAEPNIIFMVAIRPIKFDFWKVWVYRIDREHTKINNQDLLNEFRKEVESDPQYKKTSQALKASFSTLHGQLEASNNNNKNNTQGNTDIPIEQRYCPCGNKYHKPWKCYMINPNVRPAGYTIPAWKQAKVDEKLKNDPE